MLKVVTGLALAALTVLAAVATAAPLNPKFERPLETEAEDIANIARGIAFLQKQQAEESGKVLRGTHAKGVCVRGELEIAALDADLAVGMFSAAGKYPATVRFANADGKILPDDEPDVRAASLAVELPGGRTDFAMNNATTFPINDAHVFGNLMIVAEHGLVRGGWQIGLWALQELRAALALGEAQKQPARDAYQSMRYWSTVPFQLGPDQAVKYSLSPCAGNTARGLSSDPDTLSLELKRHVQEDGVMSCFDLQVQRLDAPNMSDEQGVRHSAIDWVENASWEWNERQAPFETVARLTLVKDSVLAAADCEALRIDVTKNSQPLHRGLGSINRARAAGEAISAKNR